MKPMKFYKNVLPIWFKKKKKWNFSSYSSLKISKSLIYPLSDWDTILYFNIQN